MHLFDFFKVFPVNVDVIDANLVRLITPTLNKNNNLKCIYFLLKDNHIKYVGKTFYRTFKQRIAAHNRSEKDFDSVIPMFVEITDIDIFKLESGMIALIKPEYNKTPIDLTYIRTAIHFLDVYNSHVEFIVNNYAA